MKNKINIFLSVLLLAVFVSACYEDKSNYDYQKLGQLSVSGIKDSYSCITFQDTLHVEPVVTSDDPEDSFSYLWTINDEYDPNKPQEELKAVTIGEERVLDYPVDLQYGRYELTLKITNNQNGLETYRVISLNVSTTFMDGFYLLKDRDGRTELDLHLADKSVIADILGKSIEGGVPGKPGNLGIIPAYSYLDAASGEFIVTKALSVCTDKDVCILNLSNMSTIYTHQTMFWGDWPAEKPYYMFHNYYSIGYTSDQGIYFSSQDPSGNSFGAGKFSLASLDDKKIVPNKYGVFSSFAYIFFDELNGRLLQLFGNTDLYEYGEEPEDLYSPNDIRHKLLYMGRNISSGAPIGYAVFEDAGQLGKHYLYLLNIDPNLSGNPINEVKEIAPNSKLNTATLIATNELKAPVLYCVTDNRLYMCNVDQETEEPLSPQGLATDEEITYLSNSYWTATDDAENNFDYLVIGTYKAGKYKVYLYNTVSGKPYGDPVRILEGEGKVVKMRFSSSLMGQFSGDNYPGSY